MNIKEKLLTPTSVVIPIKILGVDCHIKRLTAERIQKYSEQLNEAQKEENTDELNKLSIDLMLDALVDENGISYNRDDLPTYKELMRAHDSASLVEAVEIVQRHSVGTIEEAEKN